MMLRIIFRLFLPTFLFLFVFRVSAQNGNTPDPLLTKDSLAQKRWVESVYSGFSLEEKLGQLFMVDVFSNGSEAGIQKVRDLIKQNHIGGVIFSKGGPGREARITNEFQEI